MFDWLTYHLVFLLETQPRLVYQHKMVLVPECAQGAEAMALTRVMVKKTRRMKVGQQSGLVFHLKIKPEQLIHAPIYPLRTVF